MSGKTTRQGGVRLPSFPLPPKDFPNMFAPLTPFLNDVTRTIQGALSSPRPQAQTRALCTLPNACEDNQCQWFSSLLQSIIPSAHAMAKQLNPLDSFMADLDQPSALDITTTRYPAADRIVALGDIHGDVSAMKRALKNARVIDENDEWIGGKTVLVQVGDQLDRGNKERAIYDLLFNLQDDAPKHGGAVHILLGNHEIMNTRLDFRYVTKMGYADFDRNAMSTRKAQIPSQMNREIRMLPGYMRARARTLCCGGPLAMQLADRARVAVIVGDNVFVHGGLKPVHLAYGADDAKDPDKNLHALNSDVRAFLMGKRKLPSILRGGSGPTWMRDYSREGLRGNAPACRMLSDTLKMLKAKRMVVGHTPQSLGINSACGGRVWKIDTGMSAFYGGEAEAIEISRRGAIKIYTDEGIVQGSARYK